MKKHNAKLQRTKHGTKDKGELDTRDCIFTENAQNRFFYCHRFSLEKHAKAIPRFWNVIDTNFAFLGGDK